MKVLVHNDGKGKDMSFEAYIEGLAMIEGYGSTQEEAVAELKKSVAEKIEEFKNIDYDIVEWVDCYGYPLI